VPQEVIALLMGRSDIDLPSHIPKPDPSMHSFVFFFFLSLKKEKI